MLTTFARLHKREPRSHLHSGVTTYYTYIPPARHRLRSIPSTIDSPSPPALPEIPASVPEFALETLKFPIDAIQQEILATTNRRVVICSCRQSGKSTTGAIKALHHGCSNPGSLTLIASRSLRQSGELLGKIIDFAKLLDLPIRRAPRHPDSLLLPNGARIIALPGKPDSLRCFSAVSLLIVDEAAYVPDELYYALRPMLATTNGPVWLLSTPRNRSGFFYDEWSSAGEAWSKFRVTAGECPRISKEFLDDERRVRGPALFQREYLCDFGYTGTSYFGVDALDDAADPDRYLAAQQFAFGRPAARIIVGFDLGQRASHSAIVALEIITGATDRRNMVTYEWIQETRFIFRRIERLPLNVPYDSMVSMLNRVIRDLGDPKIVTLVVDATGCGQPFIEILRKQKMGVLIAPIGITSGGTGSYHAGIQRVPKKDLMSGANYVLVSQALAAQPGMPGLKELKEEMEAYRVRTSRSGNDTFRTSDKDDLVMAFALAAWRARPFLPRAQEPPS